MSALLEIEHLRVELPLGRETRTVLHDVSLAVGEGEAVGLVGASGSGKTMTARAAVRLLPSGAAVGGSVRFESRDVLGLDRADLLRYRAGEVGMIFQDPRTHINPVRRIGDFLTEALVMTFGVPRAEAIATVTRLLGETGIEDPERRLRQYPHELSGGQLQRVTIAAALACEPRLLIADEPTTALDVTTQSEVMALLDELRRSRGLALLFITHDLNLAAAVCDRIAVMDRGKIVEDRRVAERRKAPDEQAPDEQGPDEQGPEDLREPVPKDPRARVSRGVLVDFPTRSEVGVPERPVLEVSGLRKVFRVRDEDRRARDFPAVDDVSFVLAGGRSLAIVGESGSGKTTIARMIVGLQPPSAGTIKVMGHARTVPPQGGRERRLRAREAQMVFQENYTSLDPRQRVGDALGEVLDLHFAPPPQERGRRVAELLESVGLGPHHALALPRGMSGGERQRVAIARALAVEPRLLVLDEAVSSLDVSTQAQILDLLAGIRARTGTSYVFISHDLGVVRRVSDEVVVMRRGRIVERGETQAILDAPSHPYTKLLLDSVPRPGWKPRRHRA